MLDSASHATVSSSTPWPSSISLDTASLQANLVDLQEEYDILKSVYEEKHADFCALSASHTALQGKLEHVTMQLEQVSAQLTTFQKAAAPAATIAPSCPMIRDCASCVVKWFYKGCHVHSVWPRGVMVSLGESAGHVRAMTRVVGCCWNTGRQVGMGEMKLNEGWGMIN